MRSVPRLERLADVVELDHIRRRCWGMWPPTPAAWAHVCELCRREFFHYRRGEGGRGGCCSAERVGIEEGDLASMCAAWAHELTESLLLGGALEPYCLAGDRATAHQVATIVQRRYERWCRWQTAEAEDAARRRAEVEASWGPLTYEPEEAVTIPRRIGKRRR